MRRCLIEPGRPTVDLEHLLELDRELAGEGLLSIGCRLGLGKIVSPTSSGAFGGVAGPSPVLPSRRRSLLFPGNSGFSIGDDVAFVVAALFVSVDLGAAYFLEFWQW